MELDNVLVLSSKYFLSPDLKLKRKASIEETVSIEEEFSMMYGRRSRIRKQMLDVLYNEDPNPKARYEELKLEMGSCEEWGAFLQGWVEGLGGVPELEQEREGLVTDRVGEGNSLRSCLEEVRRKEEEELTCGDCRMTFTYTFNRARHR